MREAVGRKEDGVVQKSLGRKRWQGRETVEGISVYKGLRRYRQGLKILLQAPPRSLSEHLDDSEGCVV